MIINGRKIEAKDLKKQMGASRSTVIKYDSISRGEYEREAAEKRKLAFNLRSSNLKWKEIAGKWPHAKQCCSILQKIFSLTAITKATLVSFVIFRYVGFSYMFLKCSIRDFETFYAINSVVPLCINKMGYNVFYAA